MSDPLEVMATGKYLRMVKRGRWEYADRVNCSGAVVIVAITDQGRLILTEQHRVPVNRRVIELPAGLSGDLPDQSNEEQAAAATRELLEETGYQAGKMTLLASGPPSAGLATEIVAFFRATNLRKIHDGGGDEHENILVHEVPLAEVGAFLCQKTADGLMVDPKIYAGLYLAGCRG